MVDFDEKVGRQLEVLYGTRDILRRRTLIRDTLAVAPGERILDLGCGPGFYVAELLEQVGATGAVVGIDPSPAMLAIAARRVKGHDNVELREGDATSLAGEEANFDAVLSVQVLEYVSDVAAALAEMYRLLKPGGRVVLWDVDWATVSLHTTDLARTRRMLCAWDEHLAHPSLPQTLTSQLRSAGFSEIRMEGHSFATNDFVPDAYGGSLVPAVARFAAGRGVVSREEAIAWEGEQRELSERGELYFACLQFCFTAKRSS